jgi:hypothetical protein
MSRANAQYNLAKPDSLAIRVASKVRYDIFSMVMAEFSFSKSDEVLDLGVTSDQSYASSSYFEMLYPYKDKIVAAGIDDARFLEKLYPGVRFVHADALDLPFEDGAFDYVHSSAVLEHVGCFENQRKMVAECARVARKGAQPLVSGRVSHPTAALALVAEGMVPTHPRETWANRARKRRESESDDRARFAQRCGGCQWLVIQI